MTRQLSQNSVRVSIPGKGVLQGAEVLDPVSGRVKCHRFSRVPYVCPPTGPRRWRKPEPLPPSFSYGSESHPGKYTKPCAPCPQPSQGGIHSYSEDCLQLNIWVPLGDPPTGGWPVLFYIHGGFLQLGSNSSDSPQYLIHETNVKCIVVSANYRLGVFGFLASREVYEDNNAISTNFGFWDQRMALEWTYDYIGSFGGNKENITVGGLSAGAYSAFHQLAHDIGPNSNRQIIRRVMLWSNGCGVQPKQLPEAQEHFNELLSVLKIPQYLSGEQKISILRSKTADELVAAWENTRHKFFRPVADGDFISNDLFESLYNGNFGRRMRELGIQVLLGDLTAEWHVFALIYPPDSYDSLVDRLSWDCPRHIAEAVCEPYKSNGPWEWCEVFGKLYADIQIHSTMRGFLECISSALPLDHIHRYRIDWRAKCIEKKLPLSVGPTHGTDLAIWLFGNGDELTYSEKVLIREWLRPVGAFLRGENVNWGTKSLTEVKYLTAEGKIEIKEDDVWEGKLPLWEITKNVTSHPPEEPSFSPIMLPTSGLQVPSTARLQVILNC